MTAYLLDTNHASTLVTPGHALILRMQRHQSLGDTFSICVPVLAEVLFGIGIAPRAEQNVALWASWEHSLACHVPDATDAKRAAELQIRLRRQGRQLATIDALIAITALRYDLVLLSTDNDFQAVPDLRRETWR
ncbi:MAG: type II toxin-antitoxin system VapC family toxin [Candidatus Viridilinea halotolerans]|uniref:Ribonuclease VapC n=1 Tax=Candidatus Viridilinea halotolerans TaxID=2491704 RepID=A0A426U8X2_9CHLR|nr:MAG: type II toxin-antitoxin system VapC family toxin [Candidatus Viridilinea halotolerans]